MAEQILLHSGSFEGLREAGSLGRPLYTLYPSLKAAIDSELGPEAALLLAEPAVDAARRRVDWYTWGNAAPEAVLDLPESARAPVYRRLVERYDELAALAARWTGSNDPGRVQLGKALEIALTPPSPANLYWVDEQPVMTYWGFFPEQQWGEPLDLQRLRAALDNQNLLPETAATDGGLPAAPPSPVADAPAPSLTPPPLPVTAVPVKEAPPATVLLKLFIVVGSKFFWGMVALAGVLALGGALLHYAGLSPARSTAVRDQGLPTDFEPLRQARLAEAELRGRLNALLLTFNERRLQCANCPAPRPVGEASPGQPVSAGQTPPIMSAGGVPPPQESAAFEADTPSFKDSAAAESGRRPAAESTSPVETVPQPSAAEREEFDERLEKAGGAVGEVAVTLIWNNKNDLDLVVLCPTGERLYYNNPRACEGALDVDRNAGKRGLTDRPVENIRWPEGRAPAGDYQVAVKYYARNDTALPPATPFQVRLLQNGRETLYQGSAIPDELKPVTTFTVER
jgi:hypothetical protein